MACQQEYLGLGLVHFCRHVRGRNEGESVMSNQNQSALPRNIVEALLTEPAFSVVLERCLEEEELIAGFCRIYEVELPRPPRNGLEAMIDKATGYQEDSYRQFFSAFIPFVHRAVYLPLKAQFDTKQTGGINA